MQQVTNDNSWAEMTTYISGINEHVPRHQDSNTMNQKNKVHQAITTKHMQQSTKWSLAQVRNWQLKFNRSYKLHEYLFNIYWVFLGCITVLHRCSQVLHMKQRGLSVGQSDCHSHEPCNNGWTNGDATGDMDWTWVNMYYMGGGGTLA